jgi:uncharacterized membrane protein YwzB
MDFTCIVLFLALYYLKPQEWTSLFATIHFVQLITLASLSTLIFRERTLKARDFFRTPQDWAVYGFFLWMVISSTAPFDILKNEVLNRLLFYVVTVQTIYSLTRLNRFLGWWTLFLVIIAILALAGEFFWDPLHSYEITHYTMKDRLVLNISTVNNPNALAHGLAPGLAMLYYFTIWKRPVFLKVLGIIGIALIAYAIYLTVSKGGYLVTGVTILAMLTFGRPKSAQIVIATVLILTGSTILYQLPRMNDLKNTKREGGIQGRVASFKHGYHYYTTYVGGVGMNQFMKRQLSEFHLSKAPHSVYNCIGSQQGRPGMFLFLLIMWSNFRTLVFMKTQSVEQERARRVLFTLVLSYAVSGWMVDFAYRPSFFLFTAAISVMHRLLCLSKAEEPESEGFSLAWKKRPMEVSVALPNPVTQLVAIPAGPKLPYMTLMQAGNQHAWLRTESRQTPTDPPKKTHQGFSLLDIAVTLVALKLVEMIWVYSINHM